MSEQAMRFNEGKPKMSFILDFPNAMEAFVRVLEFGAKKYARNNWKKGRGLSDTRDSQLRHAFAFHNGQDYDTESSCIHLANEMVNIAFMIEFMARYGDKFDDRDKNHVERMMSLVSEVSGALDEPKQA